jgi:YegS/Rv2252/BmrU family lipid kinase
MPNYRLVLNTASGNAKNANFWIEKLHESGIEVAVCEPDTDSSSCQGLDETDWLIVAGGDGTVRLHAAACSAAGCTLGVLPSGTGNDFARGLRIPLDPREAARTIRDGIKQAIDVGEVDGEVFLNAAHVGFAANVTRKVPPARKGWWGRFAYPRTVLERLRDLRGFKATILGEAERHQGRWLQVTVANGSSFGGGQQVLDANPFDGQLDVFAIRPRPVTQLFFLWLLTKLMKSAPSSPALLHLRGTRFDIIGDPRMRVIADGELLGRLPARFTVHRSALQVVTPSPDG